jgi:phosphotransferase system enzyme I (PtsI)
VKLAGIPASPGLAAGPVFRFEREELTVRESAIAPHEVEAQLGRFHAALDTARHDLAAIRDGIAAELGEHEARIYDAHLLILDDPDLLDTVEKGVREMLLDPAYVFRAYMSRVAAAFEQLEDEYLRERRADIIDCERRVLRELLGRGASKLVSLEIPSIIFAHDLGPSEVAMLPRGRVIAFVTEVGGRTSHGAIVARGRGIPAIVSVRDALLHVKTGDTALVNGFEGLVDVNPDEAERSEFSARSERLIRKSLALAELRTEACETRDGRVIELGANLESPDDVDGAVAAGAGSIGLFRTEFFYMNRVDLPGEEEQYQAYRRVTAAMEGRPVLFRTMDLGGDKVASYLGMTHETNPFLGLRGIRLALSSPEMFRTQIRAIYRASAHGKVRMMFPMVSSVDELLGALALRDAALDELRRDGKPFDPDLETGIMIETPSAVWMADALAKHAAFFSIGSNDLIQYTLAMDRDNERLSHLYEPLDPAVLRSIRHTVDAAHAAGRWVGVCGEMASDPQNAVLLLGLGVDELSVPSPDLPRVKLAIRSVRHSAAQAIAEETLLCSSATQIRRILRQRVDSMLPSVLVYERMGEGPRPEGVS